MAVGLAAALSGCVGYARVSTQEIPASGRKLERTIVFVNGGRVEPELVELFKGRLVAALEARGVRAKLGMLEGKLALETPPSLEEQASAVEASTMILMGPRGGLLDGKRLASQYFTSRIYDVATGKLLWSAFIRWDPGSVSERSADVVVNELLAAFEVAGLIGPGLDGPIPPAWRAQWLPQ